MYAYALRGFLPVNLLVKILKALPSSLILTTFCAILGILDFCFPGYIHPNHKISNGM